mmetsp:Transcript_1760/g.5804  ORF Transcript_1760/g.5804 Transcript_1760/m.5804 type:complete len:300 (+) Transcript_1760:321-1220(+)
MPWGGASRCSSRMAASGTPWAASCRTAPRQTPTSWRMMGSAAGLVRPMRHGSRSGERGLPPCGTTHRLLARAGFPSSHPPRAPGHTDWMARCPTDTERARAAVVDHRCASALGNRSWRTTCVTRRPDSCCGWRSTPTRCCSSCSRPAAHVSPAAPVTCARSSSGCKTVGPGAPRLIVPARAAPARVWGPRAGPVPRLSGRRCSLTRPRRAARYGGPYPPTPLSLSARRMPDSKVLPRWRFGKSSAGRIPRPSRQAPLLLTAQRASLSASMHSASSRGRTGLSTSTQPSCPGPRRLRRLL